MLSLFEDFEDFINNEEPADYYFETDLKSTAAQQAGLVESVNKNSIKQEKLWDEYISRNNVVAICKANGIQPTKRNSTNIKKLLEKNIPLPYEGVRPTQLLKDCYTSFVDLYIEEIKRSTNHFHPLLFKSLWNEVHRECCNEDVEKKVKHILAAPYWKDWLYKIGKDENDDEDDFDEDEDDDNEDNDDDE